MKPETIKFLPRIVALGVGLLCLVGIAVSSRGGAGRVPSLTEAGGDRYVIIVSVDGLRPDAYSSQGAVACPNFFRLRAASAWTDNARSDFDYTLTGPNHVGMVTGRKAAGTDGHGWLTNNTPAPTATLHLTRGSYVASIFDVAHDRGLRTGFFSSKDKLAMIDQSYRATTGAADLTGADNGPDKIDVYTLLGESGNTAPLVDAFLNEMTANPCHLSFVHLVDPDVAGHASGWPSVSYLAAVRQVDTQLGRILDFVEANPTLRGRTTVLVTADHGGSGAGHNTSTDALSFTVPFFAWGAGVKAGADLYALNAGVRTNPAALRPTYVDPNVPIRNAEVANLGLAVLGLPPVPGSTVNARQNLALGDPALAVEVFCLLPDGSAGLRWTPVPGYEYTVESRGLDEAETWQPVAPAAQWPTRLATGIDASPNANGRIYRVVATRVGAP